MTEHPRGQLDQWVLGIRALAGAEYRCADTWSALSWRDWDLPMPPDPKLHSGWITLTQAAAVLLQQPCERLFKAVHLHAPKDVDQSVQLLRTLLPAAEVQVLADADLVGIGNCVDAGGLAILALTDERSAPARPQALLESLHECLKWALVTGVSRTWTPAHLPDPRPTPAVLWLLAPWLDDVWGMPANAKLVPAASPDACTSLQLRSLDGHIQAVQGLAAVGVFPQAG